MKSINNKSNFLSLNNTKKNNLFQNLKPYRQINNSQSPIEQQFYRACFNFITILISLFILISITILVYYISKYFIDENISRKSNRTKIFNRQINILLHI